MNVYDFNRDKTVDTTDQSIADTHYTFFLNALNLITTPVGSAPPPSGGSSQSGDPAASPGLTFTPPGSMPTVGPSTVTTGTLTLSAVPEHRIVKERDGHIRIVTIKPKPIRPLVLARPHTVGRDAVPPKNKKDGDGTQVS
jgi:hypothetical protein